MKWLVRLDFVSWYFNMNRIGFEFYNKFFFFYLFGWYMMLDYGLKFLMFIFLLFKCCYFSLIYVLRLWVILLKLLLDNWFLLCWLSRLIYGFRGVYV